MTRSNPPPPPPLPPSDDPRPARPFFADALHPQSPHGAEPLELTPDMEVADGQPPAGSRRRSGGGLSLAIAVILGGLSAGGIFLGLKASGVLDPASTQSPPPARTNSAANVNTAPMAADNANHTNPPGENQPRPPRDLIADTRPIVIPPLNTLESPDDPSSPPSTSRPTRSPASNAPGINNRPNTAPRTTTPTPSPASPPARTTVPTAPVNVRTPDAPPDPDAVRSAQDEVQATYRERIRAAKTLEERKLLAENLLSTAEAEPNPARRFALFDRAMHVAIDSAHPELTDSALRRFTDRFDVDDIPYRVRTVETWSAVVFNALKGDERDAQQRMLCLRAADVADECLARKDFETADKMYVQAALLRKSSGDKAQEREYQRKSVQVRARMAARRQALGRSQELAENPDDRALHQTVGLAYARAGLWSEALPLLARAENDALAQLADRDLQSAPGNELELGDQWWDLAATLKSEDARVARIRAVELYERAVPSLAESVRERVLSRMKSDGPAETILPEPLFVYGFESSEIVSSGRSSMIRNQQGDYVHATLAGGLPEPGFSGQALRFQNARDRLVSPRTESIIGPNDPFTLSLWCRPDSVREAVLAGKFENPFRNLFDFALRLERDGRATALVSTTTGPDVSVSTPDPLPQGTWTHLACTWKAGRLRLYINGFLTAEQAGNPEPLSARYEFALGAPGSEIRFGFSGALDEVSLFRNELSPAAIAYDYLRHRP